MTDSLVRRLWTYQAERFPLAAYLPLMAVAAFAAVAASAAARQSGRIPWTGWAVGVFTLLVLFFFLRALDEHKDAPDDARYRPDLPVPRGLVTLRELRGVAALAVLWAVALNALLDPGLLVPLAAALAWAGLMGREFFVRSWLRARPLWYLLSHMVVMPLIFLYATALDWLPAGAPPPPGTGAFLVLAFCNGLVLEIGRKVRAPGDERVGVDTYTSAWGRRRATGAWLGAATAAAAAGVAVAAAAGEARFAPAVLVAVLLVPVWAGARFVRSPVSGRGRRIELASAVWVLASYAVVGAAAWLRVVA